MSSGVQSATRFSTPPTVTVESRSSFHSSRFIPPVYHTGAPRKTPKSIAAQRFTIDERCTMINDAGCIMRRPSAARRDSSELSKIVAHCNELFGICC
jgi:hypothetical protein